MVRFNKRIQHSVYALAALLLASCSEPKEEGNEVHKLSQGKIDIKVSVTLPQPKLVKASTRDAGYYEDKDILSFDLLIFDQNAKFIERVEVEESQMKTTDSELSFTTQLSPTSEKRIFHLVANARVHLYSPDATIERVNFEVLGEKMDENTVIPLLRSKPWPIALDDPLHSYQENAHNRLPLLMWGRFVLDDGILPGTNISGVQLLRATAAIEVKKGVASEANGLKDFTLASIFPHHAYADGFLTPTNFTGIAGTPTTANPLPNSEYLDVVNPHEVSYNFGDAFPPTLYVYERNCTPDDYMSIIIQGIYKGKRGESDSYYKVAITDEKGIPLDIIRNHRYILTVVSVKNYGASSLEEAKASPPSNAIEIELKNEDTDFSIIVADKQNILAASNNECIVYNSIYKRRVINGELSATHRSSAFEICRIYYGPSPLNQISFTQYALEPSGSHSLNPPFIVHGLRVEPDGDGYYRIITDSLTYKNSDIEYVNMLIYVGTLSLPIRMKFFYTLGKTTSIHDDFLTTEPSVHDMVDPTDKNWNIRIVDDTSPTPWVALHPTDSEPLHSPGLSTGPEDGIWYSELSSKYHSHAYAHINPSNYNQRVILLKRSFSGGEPKVTKIIIDADYRPDNYLAH